MSDKYEEFKRWAKQQKIPVNITTLYGHGLADLNIDMWFQMFEAQYFDKSRKRYITKLISTAIYKTAAHGDIDEVRKASNAIFDTLKENNILKKE